MYFWCFDRREYLLFLFGLGIFVLLMGINTKRCFRFHEKSTPKWCEKQTDLWKRRCMGQVWELHAPGYGLLSWVSKSLRLLASSFLLANRRIISSRPDMKQDFNLESIFIIKKYIREVKFDQFP